MARHTTILAGLFGAVALFMMALASTPAHAFYNYCDDTSGLPCVYWSANSGEGSGTYEASVEEALELVTGDIIDVMEYARVTPGDTTDNDLKLYGSGWSGYWKFYGDSSLLDNAYFTMKAGTNYVLYKVTDLILYTTNDYVKGEWTTKHLWYKDLSHLVLWIGQPGSVNEPGALVLLLTGLTVLAWRRSRKGASA